MPEDFELPALPPDADLTELHHLVNESMRRIAEALDEVSGQATATVTPAVSTTTIIQTQTSVWHLLIINVTPSYTVPVPTGIPNGALILYKLVQPQAAAYPIAWNPAFGQVGSLTPEPDSFSTVAFHKVSDARLEVVLWPVENQPNTPEVGP